MQNAASLAKLLLTLAPILDYERPVRQPIPRHEHSVSVFIGVDDIATAALETDDPMRYAAMLDVLTLHESGARISLVGDSGASCGSLQTPCAVTPGFARCTDTELDDTTRCHHGWAFHNARGIALAQARKAVSILRTAVENCSEHPIFRYASGQCSWSRTASLYEIDVNVDLSQMAASEETASLSP